MFYWATCIILGFISRILFRLQIKGLENIPKRGPFILACNHRSNLDPILIPANISRKVYVLGKKELFKKPFKAKIMRMLDIIELDREGIDRGALRRARSVLQKGRGLLLFPEGTRRIDGRLGEPKAGVALFAFGGDFPVIPIFITGTEKAMPPKQHFVKPSKVKMTIGESLTAPKITDKSMKKSIYQDFTKRIMQEIAKLQEKEEAA
ncbi:MAG: 1-acyl-sn-glycerol-3-phosphate acyltransferase [Candidatus Omnitrophica bacterium]|nr:1-acyl-sn-glycerol-3-phosphate acyltransferase [Candidatus Omnitrophota bacterium]